jgi:hypothetical protein
MSDCGVCIGGEADGYCEFWDSKIVKARKPHKCYECRREIPVGAQYEYVAGKYDGDFFTHKTCLVCAEIRDSFSCGGGVQYGSLWEDMHYAFPEVTTGCLTKLKTPEAKAYLLERWNKWKFDRD